MNENSNAYQKISKDIKELEKKILDIKSIDEFDIAEKFKKRIESLRNESISIANSGKRISDGSFNELIRKIQDLENDINIYLGTEGKIRRTNKECNINKRKLNNIIIDSNKKNSSELWIEIEKIIKEIEILCEKSLNINIDDFNKDIAKAILSILIKQAKLNEKINLNKARKLCNEKYLLEEIKEKLINIAEKENNIDTKIQLIQKADNLNIEDLSDDYIWEKLAGVQRVKIINSKAKNTKLNSSKFKLSKLLGLTVYTFGDIDQITNKFINIKKDYGIFPKQFSEKHLEKLLSIEIIGTDTIKSNSFFPFRNSLIQEIIIADSIEEIESDAFRNLNAKLLIIKGDINKISRLAFLDSQIEQIEFSDYIKELPMGLFLDCEHLKNVKLGKDLKKIPCDCFTSSGITSINIPDKLEIIGYNAFSFCDNLKSIKLGNNLKEIGSHCFWYSGLENIEIPDSVEKIGRCAFEDCYSLKKVKLGKNVQQIPEDCFKSSGIEYLEIELPNKLINISDTAFQNCNNLKHVILRSNEKEVKMDFQTFIEIYKKHNKRNKQKNEDDFIGIE